MDKLQDFFQKMQEYQYISFDIFDTLLKRTIYAIFLRKNMV